MKMSINQSIRQPRLSVREVEFRNEVIAYCWKNYKKILTMQEMASAFRMPLAQFYKIVKNKHEKEKRRSDN